MARTDHHCRPGARGGFTAIELMVVVSIIILLVAMTVPSIFPAIRKGRVHDAANAIMRVASQARQLARTRPQPLMATPPFYGVAVVVPGTGPAYAVLTYDDGSSPSVSTSGLKTQYDTNKYVSLQAFNANVMPFTGSAGGGGPGSKTVYSLQSAGSVTAWYYQYRTGFEIQNSATWTVLGNVGVPSVAANAATGTPSINYIGTPIFGVCSLDQQYCVAIAIYSVGLANAQDLF